MTLTEATSTEVLITQPPDIYEEAATPDGGETSSTYVSG